MPNLTDRVTPCRRQHSVLPLPFDLQHDGVAGFKAMQSGSQLFDRLHWGVVEGVDYVARVKTATLGVRSWTQCNHNDPRTKRTSGETDGNCGVKSTAKTPSPPIRLFGLTNPASWSISSRCSIAGMLNTILCEPRNTTTFRFSAGGCNTATRSGPAIPVLDGYRSQL